MTAFISQFHFLRPEALALLLCLPLLYWLGLKGISTADNWAKVIPSHLLKALRDDQGAQKSKRSAAAPCLLLALTSIALAGPTWQQKQIPVAQLQDDMVVVLDLSISMLASDISPNRLTRAKQKLQDLLALRTEGSTALIVFSGDAHVVTPLSDDINTILANMAALSPFTMPVIGSRPDLAIAQAVSLFEGAQAAKGRIVMLSDGATTPQAEAISERLSGTNFSLNIISVGTALGAPIDLGEQGYLKHKGEVVIPKTDHQALRLLAQRTGGLHSELSLNDDDLNALNIALTDGSAKALQTQDTDTQTSRQFDQWHDMGVYLLPLIAVLALLFHRQNMLWAMLLLLLPALTPLATPSAHAQAQANEQRTHQKPEQQLEQHASLFNWQDLWQTRDQQAQKLAEQGQFSQAASLFESVEHRAHAHFKAQEYEEAIAQYQLALNERDGLEKAELLTDLANAQALTSNFNNALQTIDSALKLSPKNTRAKRSKALIEDLKKQQEQQEQQNQQQGQDPNQDQNQGQNQDQNEQQQGQQGQQGQDSDKTTQNQQQNSSVEDQAQQNQKTQSEASTQTHQAQQSDESTHSQDEAQGGSLQRNIPLSSEEQQAFEQWMNRVPDDPSELLKRKFQQQARQRNRTSQDPGDPLW